MEIAVDGATAHVDDGPGAGQSAPAVLLVHRAGQAGVVWSEQVSALDSAGRRPLAVDLPGHGQSQGKPPASIADGADWCFRLLDALAVEAAAVAGFSTGALMALEMAARAPERVRSLALCGVAARMPVHPKLLGLAEANDPEAVELIGRWGHENPDLSAETIALMTSAGPGVVHAGLKSCDDYKTALDAAGCVACPTVLVLGEKDLMTPPEGAAPLADALTDARTVPPAGLRPHDDDRGVRAGIGGTAGSLLSESDGRCSKTTG